MAKVLVVRVSLFVLFFVLSTIFQTATCSSSLVVTRFSICVIIRLIQLKYEISASSNVMFDNENYSNKYKDAKKLRYKITLEHPLFFDI